PLMSRPTRRHFLRVAGLTAAGLVAGASACSARPVARAARQPAAPPASDQPYLAVARGLDPAASTRAAIAALGGMGRFVRSGQDVIVKPNICVDYHPPEYAVTTNPVVVGTLVSLCLAAGAARVRVMDTPLGGTAVSAYAVSGIAAAVRAAGGEMQVMRPDRFISTAIPAGRDLSEWPVYQDAFETDVLINVPIAKQHSLARLSLGCKNLLGLVGTANRIHLNLGQRVADLTSVIRPTLTVVDAVRILVAHGPTGGSLNDVKQTNTVIASHDPVTADAFAASLFGLDGAEVEYIKLAGEMGLGTLDWKSVKREEINA
ncbi:MAG: DUF362 domain-containing protein, partial [Rudaea sp.]